MRHGTVPDERKEKSDWMDTIHRDARYGDAHSSDHPHPQATYKVVNHLSSVDGMKNFRMELNRIKLFLNILCCRNWAVCSMCYNFKSRCHL